MRFCSVIKENAPISSHRPRATTPARHRTFGTVTLELVLAFPVLLFLVFGAVEFGQFVYIKHCFESAARDAARVAILPNSTQAQVASVLSTTLGQANVTFNSSWLTITDLGPGMVGPIGNVASVPMGDELQLTLSVTYSTLPSGVRPLSSMTGVGISATKVVAGECTMIKE
jgi:hypothetical protein